MKTYKYWFYYLKKTNELYAYTDNKNYAKEFENMRNMKKFKRVVDDISTDELRQLVEEYKNKYLIKTKMDVYDKNSKEWFKQDIILTSVESITIQNTEAHLLYKNIYSNCWDDPYIFKSKVHKALETLEYVNVYQNYIMAHSGLYQEDELNIKIDKLGIFIRCYGKTLK